MKIIASIIFLITSIISPVGIKNQKSYSDVEFESYKSHFKWLTKDLFYKVQKYSIKNKVDTSLTLSIIWSESRGHWWAKGKPVKYGNVYIRAKGYMQVMDFHYNGNPNDILNTDINLNLGTKYLYYCIRLANYNLVTALKNYNSGPASKYYNTKYIKEITRNYTILNYKKMIGFKQNGLDWS